jgi:hypothetical protein
VGLVGLNHQFWFWLVKTKLELGLISETGTKFSTKFNYGTRIGVFENKFLLRKKKVWNQGLTGS